MASPTSSVSSPTTPVVKSNTVIPIALESNHSNAGLTNNLCSCDVFKFVKIMTLMELIITGLVFFQGILSKEVQFVVVLLWSAYLVFEYYGIHKRNYRILLVGSVIRCLKTLCILVIMIITSFVWENYFDETPMVR